MTEPKQLRATLRISGMTCASCELLLERKLKTVGGVLDAEVDHRTGIATIVAHADNVPSSEQIEAMIRAAGYGIGDDPAPGGTCRVSGNGVLSVRIDGMTCKSCEGLLKQKLKLVSGVKQAVVSYQRGTAKIYYDHPPHWKDLQDAVESAGYQLRHPEDQPSSEEPVHRKWVEIGGALLVIFALYHLLRAFDIVALAASATGAATLGGVFVIGLVAGTSSCLAVTGGLLLSVAAKYNEAHPAQNRWEKFKPLLHFNIGRIASYFVLGGLVGLVGQSITLTPRMTGYMNIAVALIMLTLALSILKIIPKGSFPIRPPKQLSRWVTSLADNPHPLAPFGLGAMTFFLPCGFTQSLQLAALASGSFLTGAFTMFTFALGTLPALLGISAISSTAHGIFSRLFLRFSGALVFILALWNLNSGLLLTGVDAASFLPRLSDLSAPASAGSDPSVTQEPDGTQTIHMRISSYGYEPRSFTVAAGKPTTVKAFAEAGIGGCTSVLTAPTLGLTKFLQPGENVLGPFTPTRDFLLTCSMGMVSARVRVVGTAAGGAPLAAAVSGAGNIAIPGNAQVVDLSWTLSGYAPRFIEVQQGRPTVVRVSSTISPAGCMSTIVFPNFNQSAFVPAPESPPAMIVLATDRAQPGDYPITCGMGAKMATLRVTSS